MANLYRKSEIPEHLQKYFRPAEIGLEGSEAEYIAHLVEVFREVRRVLHPSGTLWVVIGDSYTGSGRGFSGKNALVNNQSVHEASKRKGPERPKCLRGIPWKLAFALLEDGWYWRSNIVWAKSNPLPHPVRDRCSSAHEEIIVFSKMERFYCDERVLMFAPNSRYFYDIEAIREPCAEESIKRMERQWNGNRERDFPGGEQTLDIKKMCHPNGRNRRDVWFPPTQEVWFTATAGSPDNHTAVFPEALVEPMVLAGSSAHGACSKCGAPWVRMVESEPMVMRPGPKRDQFTEEARGVTSRTAITGTMVKGPTRCDLGWEPSCSCEADVNPCVVLDPFNGIGTTGVVATRLGRTYYGVELREEYIASSHRRIVEGLEVEGTLTVEEAEVGDEERRQLGLFGGDR